MKTSYKEAQVYNYLEHCMATIKRMPTRKEIYEDVDIGNGSLARIIARLEKKKKIVKTAPTIPYAIRK